MNLSVFPMPFTKNDPVTYSNTLKSLQANVLNINIPVWYCMRRLLFRVSLRSVVSASTVHQTNIMNILNVHVLYNTMTFVCNKYLIYWFG